MTLIGSVHGGRRQGDRRSLPGDADQPRPGDTITCTATYTVTQADIDAGSVTNIASASGSFTFAGDQSPTVITSPTDTLTIAAARAPTLTIAKTSTTTSVTTVGQVIPYSYAVTNTGNVTMTGLALADTNTDAAPVCLVTTLAPGESTTCTAVHTVTQAELDAGGSVSNSVTATTGQGATATDSLDIPISQSPKLTIAKSITAGDPYDSVGDTITYSYTVTNSGNVTISAIAVSDDTVDAPPVCLATTLAPAASTTCTATYTVTQADLDAGTVTNVAGATGTPAGGSLVPPTDSQTAQATRSPVLTLEKTITSGDPYTTPGATIGYSYTVTNTRQRDHPRRRRQRRQDRHCPGLPGHDPRPRRDHDLHRRPHRDPGRPRRGLGHQPRQRPRHPGRRHPRPADRPGHGQRDPGPGPDHRQDLA